MVGRELNFGVRLASMVAWKICCLGNSLRGTEAIKI